tara:strand:- start:116 stop:277 length:162 start_codon:yes stop_codon:yes gene_type:complete
MISTVTNLSLKTRNNNTIDDTTGDWLFVPGENDLYLVNNKNSKKYKIDITEVS